MSSEKVVRYVVSRLTNPDNLDGEREPISRHPYLNLARKHADLLGPGTCVDAEGGTYHFDGPRRRHGRWQLEWTNYNLYHGAGKRSPEPEL